MSETPFRSPVKLLVQVITGGRPILAERMTAQYLPELAEIADVEWCIREDHVDSYERDDFPFNVYTTDFANEYARTHWRHKVAEWAPGGFFGAFPGREWACRTAEERGYDAVLQLDDNVKRLGVVGAHRPFYREISSTLEIVSIMAELSASTNASMLGIRLDSIPPSARTKVLRPGFPYSFFIEKVGAGRLPYYGPFEDDIMHALDYGLSGGSQTAALIESISYVKDSASKSGMRSHYNPQRGLEIARRYPRNVSLVHALRTSGPKETERGVRHTLRTTGFSPVRVIDSPRYARVRDHLTGLLAGARQARSMANRKKMRDRAGMAVADDELV